MKCCCGCSEGEVLVVVFLENRGTIEHAEQIASHESPRTTKLYDRTSDAISLLETHAPVSHHNSSNDIYDAGQQAAIIVTVCCACATCIGNGLYRVVIETRPDRITGFGRCAAFPQAAIAIILHRTSAQSTLN